MSYGERSITRHDIGAITMGSSFTEFGGEGFWARDAHIELWLELLVRQIEQIDDTPGWLKEVQKHWHLQATVGFNGCVSASLDEYLTSPERVQVVIGLAERTLAWIRAQGPVLPKGLLNSFGLGGPGSCFTNDVEVDLISRVGEAFVQLLQGELVTDRAMML